MRGLMLGLLTAAVVLGYAALSRADDPPDDPPVKKSSGLLRLLGFGRKADNKAVEAKHDEMRKVKIDPAVLVAREKAEHGRRMEVCNRLREIAFQTKDDELANQADQLERKAFELFLQRVALINSTSSGSDDDDPPPNRRPSADRVAGTANGGRSGNSNRTPAREDD